MNTPIAHFLGLTTVDLQYDLPVFPEPNTKVRATDSRLDSGGPAFNAAATFAHLGGQAHLHTIVGKHAFSSFIQEEADRHAVILHDLDPQAQSITLSSVLNTPGGARTIVTHRQEGQPVVPVWEMGGVDIALVDGFHLEAAIPFSRKCQSMGVPVVLDGGSWKPSLERLLPFVDIAICSADFRLAEGSLPDWEYFREKGATALVITHGEENIAYWSAEEAGEVAVPVVQVMDTLGAGDVFHGAFCWFFSQKNTLKQSLDAAARVASLACTYPGARGWMAD